jgi:hypothetical protein
MARRREGGRPTPELQQRVCAAVRAGSFAVVAAEAAGLPAEKFEQWQQRRGRHRHFIAAVRQAAAQSRLWTEMQLRECDPKTWLLCGPGRHRPDLPGWSSPARAPLDEAERANLLAHPRMAELWSRLRQALRGQTALVGSLGDIFRRPRAASHAPRSRRTSEQQGQPSNQRETDP